MPEFRINGGSPALDAGYEPSKPDKNDPGNDGRSAIDHGRLQHGLNQLVAGEQATSLAPLNRYLAPALWMQVFREAPYHDPVLSVGDRQLLLSTLDTDPRLFARHIEWFDYRGAIDQLKTIVKVRGSNSPLVNLLDEARQGMDSPIARVLEGLAMARILETHTREFNKGDVFDLSHHYFPIWYALNLARDVVGLWKTKKLRQYFEESLKNLNRIYWAYFKENPPQVYSKKNWERVVSSLPRAKAGIAFLSKRSSAFQKAMMVDVPTDFPMMSQPTLEASQARFQESLSEKDQEEVDHLIANLKKKIRGIPFFNHVTVGRVGGKVLGFPDQSLAASGHTLFMYAMGATLATLAAVPGRLRLDKNFSLFNRVFDAVCREIMQTTGWSVDIDDESLKQIATGIIRAQVEGRPLRITSMHGSWVDITALTSIFGQFGVRFIFKKGLLLVPGLNFVLMMRGMIPLVRPRNTGDPHVDGMDTAKAIAQVEAAKEGSDVIDIDFTSGTRSSLNAVGEAKKGMANQAVDEDALVLDLAMLGTGQIMPRGPSVITKGIGTHRQVTVRAALIDSGDYEAPPKIKHPLKRRKHHVSALQHAFQERQTALALAAMQHLYEQATLRRRERKAQLPTASKDVALTEVALSYDPIAALSARKQFNERLDLFAEAFRIVDLGDDLLLQKWCRSQSSKKELTKIDPDFVKRLRAWIPADELESVYRRAGYQPTWLAMKDHRVGKWAIANVASRVLKRVMGKKAKVGQPPIYLHPPRSQSYTFLELEKAHALVHADDYARVKALVASQLEIQSPDFRDNKWPEHLEALARDQAEFRRAMASFVDDYGAMSHPIYDPVVAAEDAFHQAFLASDLLRGLDENLRLFAFYTLRARDDFLALNAKEDVDPQKLESAREHYFRLLGRGIRYRLLNRVQQILEGNPLNRKAADFVRALIHQPAIRQLRARGEQAELVAELLARNSTLIERLDFVKKEIEGLRQKKKLGWVRKNWIAMGSYTAVSYQRAQKEKRHLEVLIKKYGDQPLVSILDDLAGLDGQILQAVEGQYAPMQLDGASKEVRHFHEVQDAQALLGQNQSVKSAWATYQAAHAEWMEASRSDFNQWAKRKLELFPMIFGTEFLVHSRELAIQIDRYEDLMQELLRTHQITPDQNTHYQQAVREYQEKFKKKEPNEEKPKEFKSYYAIASDMKEVNESKAKEPARSRAEEDVFFAWLTLHRTVTQIYREVGHPHAGKIRFMSCMFTDQVEFLNRLASKEMEGLKPILESLTLEQLEDLYYEIFMAGNDPRVLDRMMARWGLEATRQGVHEVHLHGVRALLKNIRPVADADQLGLGGTILVSVSGWVSHAIPQSMALNANHQGFSDYTFMVAMGASLGLQRPWVIYEKKNFDLIPVLGHVLPNGDGIGFERESGQASLALQRANRQAIDHGVSPIGFGHGTRRFVTSPNPLAASQPLGAFVPREFVFGGNIAEIEVSARDRKIPVASVFQDLPFNHRPDIGLTGDIGRKNFKEEYSFHAGARLGGRATMAFAEPIPGEILPKTADDLVQLGIEINGNGIDRKSRQVSAAHAEISRFLAMANASVDQANFMTAQGSPAPTGLLPDTTEGTATRGTSAGISLEKEAAPEAPEEPSETADVADEDTNIAGVPNPTLLGAAAGVAPMPVVGVGTFVGVGL